MIESLANQSAVGQIIGDYELLRIAGYGGMGIVYEARQRSLDRTVAVKVIREEVARTDEYRDRFLREARLAASVDHPHVVSVHHIGDEDGRLFLALQWVDGLDLKRVLEGSGRLSPDRAVLIATQLAGAIDALHATGLIHRDIKPANVLVRQVAARDHVYLTDFGVARPPLGEERLTRTGALVGTVGYVSPEQIRGQEPGPRSDLYALGCLFFETICGRPPFEADNELALHWMHVHEARPLVSEAKPELGTGWDEFIQRALSIDPAGRFTSGREFAMALADIADREVAGDAVFGATTEMRTAGATTEMRTAGATELEGPAPGATEVDSRAGTDSRHTPTTVGQPVPLPAGGVTPPQQPGGGYGYVTPQPPPPGYGYATPPPPSQQRSGNPLALVILGLIALAGIAVGGLAAAGIFSGGGSKTQTVTTQQASHIAHRSATTRKQQPKVQTATKTTTVTPTTPAPASGAAAPTSSCGSGVLVNGVTSCGFAENVASSYAKTNGGNQTITAFSPATGRDFTVDCVGGSTVVCSGGTTNGGALSFRAGSQHASAPSSGTPAGLRSCGASVSANSATSCGFAQNVLRSYSNSLHGGGGQNQTVTATSPATGKTYGMDCTSDGSTVVCTGGVGAEVSFPLSAA